MLEQTGLRRARRRRARQAVGRQPPAREHRGRPARRPAGAAARRAVLGAGPAPAPARVGVLDAHGRGAARRSSSRPTTSPRPSATPTACSSSPTASCSSPARPASLRDRGRAGDTRLRGGVRAVPARAGPLTRVRWLLLKDLQILRRSPLLVVAARRLSGARSRCSSASRCRGGPEQAEGRVPQPGARGRGRSSASAARSATPPTTPSELFKAIDPIRVHTRERGGRRLVESGDALGALIIPPTPPSGCASSLSLTGGVERPQVEVIYNGEDPLKQQFVESTIESQLAEANLALSSEIPKVGAEYLDILLKGGTIDLFLAGDQRARPASGPRRILRATIAALPRRLAAARRARAGRAVRAARGRQPRPLRRDPASISEPVQVKQTVLDGSRTPLDTFAVAIAVTVSLMFVTRPAGGGDARARARGARVRPARPRPGHAHGLLAEKIAAGGAVRVRRSRSLLVAGLGLFVDIDWGRRRRSGCSRSPSARSRSARSGVAIGAAAREVRAASLLAFLLSLPIAFLALVPERRGRRRRSTTSSRRSPPRSRSTRRWRRSTRR